MAQALIIVLINNDPRRAADIFTRILTRIYDPGQPAVAGMGSRTLLLEWEISERDVGYSIGYLSGHSGDFRTVQT